MGNGNSRTPLYPWDKVRDATRACALMARVLGWECFTSWESYLRTYGAQEWAIGAGQTFTTPTHVAFCVYRLRSGRLPDHQWRVFTPDHEELFVFDPLYQLDDARRLLVQLCQGENQALLQACAIRLFPEAPEEVAVSLLQQELLIAPWTPEQICRATYDAVTDLETTHTHAKETL